MFWFTTTPSPRTPILVILLSYTTFPCYCLMLLIVLGRSLIFLLFCLTAYCLGCVTALHCSSVLVDSLTVSRMASRVSCQYSDFSYAPACLSPPLSHKSKWDLGCNCVQYISTSPLNSEGICTHCAAAQSFVMHNSWQ